jgi:hypothetical protein
MAMIVSNAARLKPEIRLAEAISLFEVGLTSAQKVELRNSRAQSLKKAPDSSDVMRLTADIDRQTKGKRCFGPRFTSFLGTVQQFAALGDVIVGGSQNIIACGVWSLVRMSILVCHIRVFHWYRVRLLNPRSDDRVSHWPELARFN